MSIFSSLIPEAHPNHNPFDLSHRDVFSVKAGMVVPVFVQDTIPNATYVIKPMNQIEVSTMAKANFARMKQNIEYYFVPYSQIWRWFETFYYQRTDVVRNPSNVALPSVPLNVPSFSYRNVCQFLYQCYIYQFVYNSLVAAWNELGLGGKSSNTTGYTGSDFATMVLKTSPLGSYFDVGTADFPMHVYDFVDVHGIPAVENALRTLDLLGYGNLLPYFQHLFYDVDLPGMKPNSTTNPPFADATVYYTQLKEYLGHMFAQNGATSMFHFIDAVRQEFARSPMQSSLQDAEWLNLGYMLDTDGSKYSSRFADKMVSAFRLLSFFKVWSDNFRSVQYDTANYSYFYNLDFMLNQNNNIIAEYRILYALIPRYRLYRRDIITGTYPNAQFGDAAVASLQNPTTIVNINPPTDNTTAAVIGSNFSSERAGRFYVGSGSNDKWNINTGISALAIRQAEALQRYREKNLRAGARIKNQQNAFYGDSSKFIQDDYSEFLFSTDANVMINSVVATGESQDIALGDKGSTAYSALNANEFTFKSHDFGCIIGVMYILPVAEYENFGFDPQVIKIENGDFFHPDFQNLGLAPVTNILTNIIRPSAKIMESTPTVIGYSAHDWEYKTALDRVHGEFNSYRGVYGDYVTPRKNQLLNSLTLQSLYVSPNDIDNIFVEFADSCQNTDQFKVNMYHEVKAVLPMSVTGLPY